MTAELDHDGVTWRQGDRPGLQIASVLALLGLLAGGSVLGPIAFGVALVLAVLPILVFVQASRRATVRLTLRCLVIETRSGLGRTTRERIPLDEIRQVRVAASSSGDFALVLGRGDTRIPIGTREPREHLEWLQSRIEHARVLFAEHERQEGREWTFLRTVPNALGDLLDHTTDEVRRPATVAPGKLTEP